MAATGAAPGRETRGSQKLLETLAKNAEMPSLDEIRKALAVPAAIQLEIPRWLIRGTPPAWLELDATLQVPVAQLGELVNHVVKMNDSTLSMEVLINGIPRPVLAQVRLRNTPGIQG